MSATLHVVFCVDTEGPLYEAPDVLSARLKYHFGLDVVTTPENIAKLRNGEGVPPENRQQLREFLDPRLISSLGDWGQIERMLDRLTSADFRCRWRDKEGKGPAFSWFCLDHVGYEENPRRRDMGHHAVFDFYRNYLLKKEDANDVVQFHYHAFPYNKKAHSCATYYLNGNHLTDILARKIIDRAWFPSAFRPGFHALRPDSHWFLEQWIPFDYSSQACDSEDSGGIASGQYGDWRRAPKLWGGYHPDHDDYQAPGQCRRWIFRCLNAHMRLRSITEQDVAEACVQAQETGVAVLAVAEHDYRDMPLCVQPFYDLVARVAKQQGVELLFSNAETAARAYAGLHPSAPGLSLSLEPLQSGNAHALHVSSDNGVFGPQPFLALKTKDGSYYHDNLDFDGKRPKSCWSYVFDWQTFMIDSIECIGVGACSASGVGEVARLYPQTMATDRHVHHG